MFGKKKEETAKEPTLVSAGKNIKETGNDISYLIKEIFHAKSLKSRRIINSYYEADDLEFVSEREKKHSKYSRDEKIVFIILALTIINILVLGISYFITYSNLKEKVLCNSFLYIIPFAIIPFIAWARGTDENFWAFHARKRLFFKVCVINAVLLLIQPLYTTIRNLCLSATSFIKTDEVMRYGKVLLLAYVGTYALSFIVVRLGYSIFEPLTSSPSVNRAIELFKLSYIMERRENSEYKYDIKSIKNLEDGSPIMLKENDRFVQTEINGPSGTGKTSSIFIPAIEEDMNTKIKNMLKRQEAFLELITNKKATLKGPLREFREDAIIPIGKTDRILKKNQKEIEKIKKQYPDCGMTIVAPNASLIKDIIRLGEARGIKVNILDPAYQYSDTYSNAKDISINPFYIPLGLDENERLIRISEAATVFADVLIATNQQAGEGDQYFTDISLAVCTNVSTVIMLANNINGEQTYIDEVQNCISNFKNLNQYVDVIEHHYSIKVNASEIVNNGNTPTSEKFGDGDLSKGSKVEKKEELDAKKNPYYQQILFVKQELTGPGAEDMFSQARGLRNLTNKILEDPRIKTRLSAAPEDRIDFDGILSNNEITVVNTAIELGKNKSTAFGLFFLLLHKASVLRRPEETRTPHFLWIDEATQYMHPCYEDMISLYRQYRCAVVITLQSLSQTQRSRATAYLKEVFLGAGTHIVFGRLTPEEMELYAAMGGISREMEEQVSTNQSSVLNRDSSFTESVRRTPTVKNIMEGADLRILGFQELTVYTIDNGRVLPGQHARVFFVSKDAFDRKKIRKLDWKRVVPEAFYIEERKKEEDYEETEAFLFAGDDEDELDYTTIPEEETRILTEKTYEPSESLEQKDINNMSIDDLFAILDGSPTEQKENALEEKEDKEKADSKSTTSNSTSSKDTPASEKEGKELSEEELKKQLEELNNR